MNYKITFTIISLFISLNQLHAAVNVEPFLGFHIESKLEDDEESLLLSGYFYGSKLGYSFKESYELGVDYRTGDVAIEDLDDPASFSAFDVYFRYSLSEKIKINLQYIADYNFAYTGDPEVTYLPSKGFRAGLSLGLQVLAFINVEYASVPILKERDADGIEADSDEGLFIQMLTLSISFPLNG